MLDLLWLTALRLCRIFGHTGVTDSYNAWLLLLTALRHAMQGIWMHWVHCHIQRLVAVVDSIGACCAGYLDALGNAMLATCQAIPHGVLCFFPSWGLLNAARDQWLVTGERASPKSF